MKITKAALAASTLLGGFALLAAPAYAQYGGGSSTSQSMPPPTAAPAQQPQQPAAGQAPAQPQRPYNISRAERTAMQPAIVAVNAGDWAAATAALPAADAAARSPDAKYGIAQIRLRIGIETNDTALQSRAVDDLIASGGAQPSEMAPLYREQARFASAAGDRAKAERAMAQLAALNPNDTTLIIASAVQKATANDYAGAIADYQRAIQVTTAAGQPVPEMWRRQIIALAYQGHLPQTGTYMRELLTLSPTPANWHDALAIFREQRGTDTAMKLDIYRLMRAVGALTSEQDYVEFSEAANQAAVFGETKALLEEGLSRNVITAGNTAYARDRIALATRRIADDRPTLAASRTSALAGASGTAALRLADAYFGYGDYPPAIELYRAAIQKGGVDASLANTRLGAALALAGQHAEAETAFRAVTGPRAELAQLWLLWLSTRR